ncbi:MAG: aminoacetone oxidase family FAD-binding enzyme [Ruminococcus sp.]|nr:aminoacetone oxidase family FAD-binding enzyme [Ruminococcus sp.]
MKSKNIYKYDVCIIGGGAAGLFCAINIKNKRPDINVAILERQKDIGRKLLATGNGRCNLTNINADASMYHGSFKKAAAQLLDTCSPQFITELFAEMGLITTIDPEGRVYPYSKHSASVLDCLRINCECLGVDIICECNLVDLNKKDDKFLLIDKDNRQFVCKKLIVASGSKATPETGADDSILHTIANKFNLRLTALSPALCPVTVKSKTLHKLKGVRANGAAAVFVNGREIKKEYGEIQFTDKALSGICLFNLSRIVNTSDASFLRLSLLPHMSEYEITEFLYSKTRSILKDTLAENLLCGVFHKKLSYALLTEAGIDSNRTLNSITKDEIRRLSKLINNWDFHTIPSNDFTRAQVVAGGIDGCEITPETMECKKVNNLYIIGEAIDCDGDCGGLNLQFAFASGYCAATEITK